MTSAETVSQFWKEFDLESRRGQFDETGFQITEEQEQSVQRRRHLAEATQKFRKSADKTVVTSVAELLKQYQQEIDRLTKRAKFGEKAFLDVYHVLHEAPDPSAALQEAVGMRLHVTELEKEVRSQAQELAEYSAESEEIRNQGTTIRRMEEKIRSLEQQLQAKDNAKETVRKEVEEEVHEESAVREAALQKLVDEANQKVEATRKLHQASQDQLLVMQSRNEELKAQYTAELEMASGEIEKAHNKITELEAELQRSPATVSEKKQEIAPEVNEEVVRLNALLEAEQKRTTSLEAELQSLRQTQGQFKAEADGREEQLRAELQGQEETVHSLEAELQQRPTNADLENLKQQLSIMQAVEYNVDVSTEDLPAKVDSMEALLLRKNKHLEHQLTAEKLKQTEVQHQLEEHQSLLASVQGELERHKELVARLEEDLLAAQNSTNSMKATSSASDMDEALQESSGGSSMVSILRNQRDRLRHRTQELESKINETEKRNRSLQADCDSISADNVALVERLRYLQGYRKEHANKLDVESGLAAEQKYEKKYEERMNPFQEFQGRQREQRRKALNLVDRSVLVISDLVFGYKYARIFLCLYIMLLHVLVMTMLGFISDRHHNSTASSGELKRLCEEHGYTLLH